MKDAFTAEFNKKKEEFLEVDIKNEESRNQLQKDIEDLLKEAKEEGEKLPKDKKYLEESD